MKKTIKIGRCKSNDLVFDFPQVSSNHAVITPIGSNSLILEDQSSSNGTFVNGVQIKRMIISKDDRIKVANILVNTKPYFVTNNPSVSNKPNISKNKNSSSEHENIKEEFRNLEEVWNTYQNVKANHKKKDFWKNMAFTAAGMGGRGAAGLLKTDEKLQVVENEFKVNYTCPKCKVFLGYNPHEGLVQRKKCFTCKTNWI